MGMPVIPDGDRDTAITDIIKSVALQEAALAHILNAEGEKMQAIIASEGVTPDELLVLNRSVIQLVSAVTRLEMTLQSKLELFSEDL
jgi:hypothetical protein